MSEVFSINKVQVGRGFPPFIIAEMSGNHNSSIERALAIIDSAAACGAHAIKLQTYTPDTITVKGAYTISDKNSLWYGRELYDLYAEAHTPWEWHAKLFERAAQKNIICFSSPFDETAVDFLEKLDCPAYKIASFENSHFPLLRKVAQTGKPIIMSTGVSTLEEITRSVAELRKHGCKQLALLKCTSSYPAPVESANILTIPDLAKRFDCVAGLSDHTFGIGAALAAVAHGAGIIEKHFTLNRKDGGADAAFSIEPAELELLVTESKRAFLSLGKVTYEVQTAEEKSLMFKPSIYAAVDIHEGEPIKADMLKVRRPFKGISPVEWDNVLSKKARGPIKKDTPITWDLLS